MSIATTSPTSSADRLLLYHCSTSKDESSLFMLSDTSPGHCSQPHNPATTVYTEDSYSRDSAAALILPLLPESPSFSPRQRHHPTRPISSRPESPLYLLSSPIQTSTPQRSRSLFTARELPAYDFIDFSEGSEEESFLISPSSSQLCREDISKLLSLTCCSQRCLAHLSVVQIESCRKWFVSRNRNEQNQFLLDTYHISGVDNSPSSSVYNILEGRAVCRKAFTTALGISTRRYQRLQEQFHKGVMHFERKPICRSQTNKVSEAKAWMTRFFNNIGDKMPHVSQVHLPHFMTKGDIYKRMKRDLLEEGILETGIISPSYFYTIWRKSFKHVIPEVIISLS